MERRERERATVVNGRVAGVKGRGEEKGETDGGVVVVTGGGTGESCAGRGGTG